MQATLWNRSDYLNLVLTHTRHQQDKPTTVIKCRADDFAFPQNDLNVVLNTCSTTEVLYMWQNDVIDLRIMMKNTVLDLSKDSTYFGVVKVI